MSYTNAVFFIDPDGGSDAVRATLTGVVFSNPSTTVVRGTKTGHGLQTGAIITVAGTTNWNGDWKVTRIDANSFDLDTAVWTSGADNTGDVVPFGGSTWADAWQTIAVGGTSGRLAGGGEVRVAKSPDPVSVGTAKWTDGPVPDEQYVTSSTNTSPIVVTRAAHGRANNDVVQIDFHEVNTAANGVWVIANVTADTFELVGSTGNGVGGATGTVREINARIVRLSTAALTRTIDRCEDSWTPATGLVVTVANAPTAGGTGYTLGDILTITDDGTFATLEVTGEAAGVVTDVTLVTSGRNYVTGTGKATSGGTGTGCTVELLGVADVTAVVSDAKPMATYLVEASETLSTASGPFTGDVLLSFWFLVNSPLNDGPLVQELDADSGLKVEGFGATFEVQTPGDYVLATIAHPSAWHHGVVWSSAGDLYYYVDGVFGLDGPVGPLTGEAVFGGGLLSFYATNIAYVQRTHVGTASDDAIASLYAAGREWLLSSASGDWAAAEGANLLAYWIGYPVDGAVASSGAATLPLTFSDPPPNVVNSGDGGEWVKEGQNSVVIQLPQGITKQSLLAYKTISPGSLTAFQELSYWITQASQPIEENELRICLCSDTSGETVVDEFVIEAVNADLATAVVAPRTSGGNLAASVGSIAIYTHTAAPVDGRSVVLDNILATVADGLNHQSLIGKNDGTWSPIQSIVGDIVYLDIRAVTGPRSTNRGYSGTSETVETFVRATHKTGSNTINGPVNLSGGWNTSTGFQDGETFVDGRAERGSGLSVRYSETSIERFSAVRFSVGVDFDNGASWCDLDLGCLAGNQYGIVLDRASRNVIVCESINNNRDGVTLNGPMCTGNDLAVGVIASNSGVGVQFVNVEANILRDCSVRNNGAQQGGIQFSGGHDNRVIDSETRDNRTCAVIGMSGINHLRNVDIDEPVEMYNAGSFGSDPCVKSHNHNHSGQHRHLLDQAVVDSLPSSRPNGLGLMWRIGLTETYSSVRTATYPVVFSLGSVAVDANKLATIRAWVKKDHATNINVRLRVKDERVAGATGSVTKANDTAWEEVELTFTPTENGVVPVELLVEYVSGNSYAYVDDISLLIQGN